MKNTKQNKLKRSQVSAVPSGISKDLVLKNYKPKTVLFKIGDSDTESEGESMRCLQEEEYLLSYQSQPSCWSGLVHQLSSLVKWIINNIHGALLYSL